MSSRIWVAVAALLMAGTSSATTNATTTGGWISVGVPTQMHLGTNGDFYVTGSDHGTCQSVQPSYFRFDTAQPKWKEMYALLLYAAANGRSFECTVDSGCGTTYTWVSYCRVSL